ncbi:TetR/AcrR family transcriptional regulator [Pseudanabaena sp. FACHB-2040]|uniref:TetR/AcrR family transcriptional regulator n=1 Tax=Pseudanabaena sp. FACHB-2040 TaxID=2692859 RepID=UPI001687A8D2|nr:TetR/AcrR family transcriptional regulator [Pseudanabaena sp. FACHB-2040]MBD2260346.1 TetR family transcriptional regulator [Pseudanabaena sp. FACHB-2040]
MVDTKRAKSRSATRETLLRAASQVVIDRGVEALTFDAVAQKAGVSKGGLLYHFPSKDALMRSMVEQLIQDFEAVVQTEFDQDDAPGTPGQWVRAYLRATLRFSQQSLALVARLSSIATSSPNVLEAAKAYESRWHQRIETSGFDPVKAAIIQLAIDGLWFSEVFQYGTPEEPLRTQVVETLLAMTRSPQ